MENSDNVRFAAAHLTENFTAEQTTAQRPAPVRLLITGGETGGHLYPSLAVADTLGELVPGSSSVYVGAAGRIGIEKIFGARHPTYTIAMSEFYRKKPLANLILPWRLLRSVLQSLRILREFRPHAVMGVGAFPSVPVIFAARICRIPILIFEPNAVPGMANKLLAGMADRICVSRPDMERFFPPEKLVATGTPVCGSLLQEAADKKSGHALLATTCDKQEKLSKSARTVLITGGSTGSTALNKIVLENIELLSGTIDHLLWQTGERDFQHIRTALGQHIPANCTILPYIDNMGHAYGIAELVVSSAGAASLSELALLGKAALIIPDPDVTENHQLKNAQELHINQACVLTDARHPTEQTARLIIDLFNDRARSEELRRNIVRHAEPHAAARIVEQILQLAAR